MSEQAQPQFGIEKIYIKDLSLEIPNAPHIFLERESPQIEISVHNAASPLEQSGLFEVVMTVTVTAKLGEKTVFLVEVAQAGIFQVVGLPSHETDAVLGIMCPNTLLPYAREAVASMVSRAGFPPVLLQHMNFEAAYQERLRQLQEEQAALAPAPA
ncbi:MAG: protein-export chaperone SecB [Burkholderiales bacterium]|nr:protein-export chaperone SecB [Burkholderiales bacterium]MDP2397976.1 protein-export chaperone SecB [Burkholderiales bacterium]